MNLEKILNEIDRILRKPPDSGNAVIDNLLIRTQIKEVISGAESYFLTIDRRMCNDDNNIRLR